VTDFVQVTPAFSVAPQLTAADFAAAKAEGFTMVIDNRPDGEEPGALQSAGAQAAATAQGMAFRYAPIVGGPDAARIEELKAILAQAAPGERILAYCRSGTRSITAWAYAQALAKAASAEELIATARAAGYDLSAHAPALRRLMEG
jgi:uncharacterized protein (TIGR01244 family)